jgi:AcrR family transcriptional regulator
MARHKQAERNQIVSETRQRLLEAAAQEFAQEGYRGANINRISQAAGFAKGTVYNYFASKRALMLGLIDEIAAHHLAYVVDQVRQQEEPQCRLLAFFQAGFSFVSGHLAQARVLVNNIYGPDAEFKVRMYQAYRPLFRFVAEEIIAPGVEQGVFRQLDPDATATLLMTLYLGSGSQVDDQGQPWLDPGLVADFALNGLCCGGAGSTRPSG